MIMKTTDLWPRNATPRRNAVARHAWRDFLQPESTGIETWNQHGNGKWTHSKGKWTHEPRIYVKM